MVHSAFAQHCCFVQVYICEQQGLPEVAKYWHSVIQINYYQKQRFVGQMIDAMFNTICGKKIAVLGFAFKKDTGDTRETPAIDVCKGLLQDGAKVTIYDPQVRTCSSLHEKGVGLLCGGAECCCAAGPHLWQSFC